MEQLNSSQCKDPACLTCSVPLSSQYKSKSLLKNSEMSNVGISAYNTYTLDLVLRLIKRKCTDAEFMIIEKIKWSCPSYVYVRSIQINNDNPINLVVGNSNDSENTRSKFDEFYAANFASIATERLQKTFVKDLEKVLISVQKEHKVSVKKISIVLRSDILAVLNDLLKKYIDHKVIDEIIKINEEM